MYSLSKIDLDSLLFNTSCYCKTSVLVSNGIIIRVTDSGAFDVHADLLVKTHAVHACA